MNKSNEMRLEQRRINRRRCREEKRKNARLLEMKVSALQLETARMEENLEKLRYTTLLSSIGAKVAIAYAKTFQYGLLKQHETTQISMLQSIMSEDAVVHGKSNGYEIVLNQWKRYSTFFHSIKVNHTNIDVIHLDTSQIVYCHGYIILQISRRTLHEIFPSILHQEHIVQRMLGQTMKVSLSRQFHVDIESSKIYEIVTTVGILQGILELLDNTQDTIRVMETSRILSNGHMPKEVNT